MASLFRGLQALILFIAGNASEATKAVYLKELFKKVSHSVYLNIDKLGEAFNQPATSEFTQQYTYEQRIKNPSHKAILEVAQDNVRLGKTVVVAGNFVDTSISESLEKSYSELLQSGIKIIYLNNTTETNPLTKLEKLADTILTIDTAEEIESNLQKIINLFGNSVNNEPNTTKPILALSAGLQAVGKTTTSSIVSQRNSNSIFLQKDAIGELFLASIGQTMPGPYYSEHIKEQTYEALFNFALDNLAFNISAIVDGWFGDKLTTPLIQPHLGATAYTTTLIYYHCSAPIEHARIIQRNAQRDEAKLKAFAENRLLDLKKHLHDFYRVTNLSSILFIDTESEENLNTNVTQILNHFNSPGLSSLQINLKNLPTEENCEITAVEAQGNLATFQAVLKRAKHWKPFWVEKSEAVPMQGFGLKLRSGEGCALSTSDEEPQPVNIYRP